MLTRHQNCLHVKQISCLREKQTVYLILFIRLAASAGRRPKTTQAILKGLVNHPNAAGVLVLGLDVKNNNIPVFKGILGDYNPERIRFMSTRTMIMRLKRD